MKRRLSVCPAVSHSVPVQGGVIHDTGVSNTHLDAVLFHLMRRQQHDAAGGTAVHHPLRRPALLHS